MQVQPGSARAPFNAQDSAEGAGRGELLGAGPGWPRPRPIHPRPLHPEESLPPAEGSRGAGRGFAGPHSLESPSHLNPDQTRPLVPNYHARPEGPDPFPRFPHLRPAEARGNRPGSARVKKLIQFVLITELFRSSPLAPPPARSHPSGDQGGGPGEGMDTRTTKKQTEPGMGAWMKRGDRDADRDER